MVKGAVATNMIAEIPFPVFVWRFIISSYRVPVSGQAELVFPLPVTGSASLRNYFLSIGTALSTRLPLLFKIDCFHELPLPVW